LGHSTYSKLNISKYTINLVEIKKLFQKKILLYIWIISIFVISICIFNYYNKIFLRGKPFNENFILYENFFKIFYKVFAAALIYFSFDLTLNSDLSKRKKTILFFLLAFILNFIYLSQLSREGGVHILVLMLSLFLIQKNKEYKENDKLYYVLIFFFFFWFILSLLFIQYQRFEVNFTISVSSPNYEMIDNSIALLFNRWVGIDAVMAIVSNNDKGWDLLNNIINNRVNWTHNVAWPNKSNMIDPFHVNLPGPAAFFYISGSFILLFFLSFITFFIFFLLESIINLIKKDFILMGNFLVFILAYRIIHTGLGLNNLFYFILLIIFCVFFLLISNYFYKFTYELKFEKEPVKIKKETTCDKSLVDKWLQQIKDDPISWLDEMGDQYENFVDKRSLLSDLVDGGDYGSINGYNGEYDTVSVGDSTFVVMRID
jgi:hypothetical protein